MPIYEYECQACGDVQELMQKISDPAPEACGACHKGPMVKMISKTSFILKGGGWYVTDFRGGAKTGGTAKAKGGGGSDDSGSSSSGAADSGGSSDSGSGSTGKSEAAAASAGGCGAGACGAGHSAH